MDTLIFLGLVAVFALYAAGLLLDAQHECDRWRR